MTQPAKHAPKRNGPQREADLEIIRGLYVRGHTYREIAAKVTELRDYSLSYQTIKNDVDEILSRWRETLVESIDKLKADELAKINEVERQAWAEWERSKLDTSRHEEGSNDKTGCFEKDITEGRLGDPRYLEIIGKCVQKRCDILGLDAPKRSEVTGRGGAPLLIGVQRMSDEELEGIIRGADEG